MENENNMLEIREARKKVGTNHILCGVNMDVQKNTIYALLGPSGCGKTMLLSCVLGLRSLTGGEIRLGVNSRNNIGYMPQEVALFNEFTVMEILRFFSTLYGMTDQELKTRTAELTRVLELSDWNKKIRSLSGGEQRRVSFAAAVIHKPALLIMDEPTVGVDPILNYSMWQYLIKQTDEGRTIIITTHYIEEAKNANKIGMMREGKLICEGTPKNVLLSQEVKTLEEAFLKLSMQQHLDAETKSQHTAILGKDVESVLKGSYFNANRLRAQILKNIIWMKRNTLIMFFLLLLPIMQSFFYSISFGHNPEKLKFIIMSEELSAHQDKDYCNYNRPPYFGDLNCTFSKPFTCHYAKELNKTLDIVFKYNEAEAESDVQRNRAWGVMHISSNFTDSLIESLDREVEVSNESLENTQILVKMDMSNYVIGHFIQRQISQDMREFMKNLATSCGIGHAFGPSPVRIMDPVFGGKDPLFSHSGLPGFYCSFCFYFTMIFTSGAIMMEKLLGTLERSMAAGMTYIEVVSAHLVVQFMLMTLQKVTMFLVFYIWFDFPLLGDLKLIFILLYFIEAVGIAYGFLLTEVFSSDRLVTYAGIGATLAVFSLGGIIWPLEGAHFLIKSWIWAFPVTPAVQSYKDIASKGYDLTYSSVYLGFLSCTIWIVLFTFISYIISKINRYNKIL